MIEAGQDKIEYALIPAGFGGIAKVNYRPHGRLLLRPQRKGMVDRRDHALADYNWKVETASYLTRAQAAQVTFNDKFTIVDGKVYNRCGCGCGY